MVIRFCGRVFAMLAAYEQSINSSIHPRSLHANPFVEATSRTSVICCGLRYRDIFANLEDVGGYSRRPTHISRVD
jgi:hypothetical protein